MMSASALFTGRRACTPRLSNPDPLADAPQDPLARCCPRCARGVHQRPHRADPHFLQSHLQTITETHQMMSEAAPGGLEWTKWSKVVALGDVVSRRATVGESETGWIP